MKKDVKNKTLCGVCSGLARSLDINPLWIRLLFVFSFYIWVWDCCCM